MAAQALVEQHNQQLADLKLEASILRQASAEHARHACHFLLHHLALWLTQPVPAVVASLNRDLPDCVVGKPLLVLTGYQGSLHSGCRDASSGY